MPELVRREHNRTRNNEPVLSQSDVESEIAGWVGVRLFVSGEVEGFGVGELSEGWP